jgi:malonyl-CoA/methylmalonyl-CoA synthetase
VSLWDLFRAGVDREPGRTAIRFGQQAISFAQLAERSGGVSRALQARRLSKGDRIALYMDNCPDLVIAYLANLRSGLIAVPMNPQYRETEIRHIVDDSHPRLILTGAAGRPLLQSLRGMPAGAEVVQVEELESEADHAAGWDGAPVEGQDPAAIMYTSGTTGPSKGAILTHDNFASNILALISAWAWTSDDVLLLTLPLFHTHGLAVALHGTLTTGCTTILRPRFKAAEVLDTLLRDPVTLFMGVPAMYVRLLEEADARGMPRVDLPHMRLFVSGSAPLSRETFERFERVFGHRILERYGMTETVMNLSNPYSSARIPGTVGLPLPGVSLRIVGDDGTDLPDGEVGELLLQGPNVFSGYWQDPEKTRSAFVVGADGSRWFRTGDLGSRDPATGYYRLAGRRHDLIICGGYNIYPREVEEVLQSHPAVLEAAVVGAPDPVLGEAPVAFVVRRSGLRVEGQELLDYCAQRIARYKVPRSVRFLPTLPRNAMGKVEKQKLKSE